MAINLNWINVEAYSFNCVLLMERFPLRMLCTDRSPEYTYHLGVVLKYNPVVSWYVTHRLLGSKAFAELTPHLTPRSWLLPIKKYGIIEKNAKRFL